MTRAQQQLVRPARNAKRTSYFDGTSAWLGRILGSTDRANATKEIAMPSGAVGGYAAVADRARIQISAHVATDASMRVAETPRRRTFEGAAADSASLCPTPSDKKSPFAIAAVASRLAFMSAGRLESSLVRTAVNLIDTSISQTQLCNCPVRRRCF